MNENLYLKNKKTSKESTKKYRQSKENFSLYSHLENELERLKTLDIFFKVKLPNFVDHPQVEELIIDQMSENQNLLKELLKTLDDLNSPLHKCLENLFNHNFKNL